MKMFLLSDNIDTLTGMRLVGIDGKVVKERHEFIKAWLEVIADKKVAILLITQRLAAQYEELIHAVKAKESGPLITTIPDGSSQSKESDFISAYIREAIGMKV